MAFELSQNKWKLGFCDRNKMRFTSMAARNLEQLQEEIDKAKIRFKIEGDVRIVSCYEAGRDGFWLHRYLLSCGINNSVVDSSSNVPSAEAEDGRQLSRELESLNNERTMHRGRIHGLLIQQGLEVSNPSGKGFLEDLDSLRTWDGNALPVDLKERLVREYERLRVVEDQMKLLRKERESRVNSGATPAYRMVAQLRSLHGIGKTSSWDFVMEMFSWRNFRNRKEVGAFPGLTPTPYDSGGSQREQGISKAGRGRIRGLNIQIAWGWLRFQPHSKLARWFWERFGHGGKRMRKIGIVAVARKLLIDLWRYLEFGVVPEGVRLRTVA